MRAATLKGRHDLMTHEFVTHRGKLSEGDDPGNRSQGNRDTKRTTALVRVENNRGVKKLPAARFAASERVGYGTIRPARADSLVRCAIASVH